MVEEVKIKKNMIILKVFAIIFGLLSGLILVLLHDDSGYNT